MESPLNGSGLKVSPLLMLNFCGSVSVIFMLKLIYIRFSLIKFSSPLLSKEILNVGYTVLYNILNELSILIKPVRPIKT
jgi:hypothetical protein